MVEKRYLFGPVPSRRLGRSLGVDIVPFKVCTLDCVYCQLGRSAEKTIERKEYVSVEPVLGELKEKLAQGEDIDFITFSGSGEPTLNSRLGEFIDGIKEITDIPVAVLTNGTLLYREDVRADCAKADVVLPSLDAADEQTFRKVNRPHQGISIEKLVYGLCRFRGEFSGQIWLEVFVVEGMNTDSEQITKIKDVIRCICPDKIQLNTAVRPTSDAGIKRVRAEKLRDIAAEFGEKCEIVADFSLERHGRYIEEKTEGTSGQHSMPQEMKTLLSMLKRRPCSINDICLALGLSHNEALEYITHLQKRGAVCSEEKDGIMFFRAN